MCKYHLLSYVVARSVVCVCVLVTRVSYAKTAEPIEMRFGDGFTYMSAQHIR